MVRRKESTKETYLDLGECDGEGRHAAGVIVRECAVHLLPGEAFAHMVDVQECVVHVERLRVLARRKLCVCISVCVWVYKEGDCKHWHLPLCGCIPCKHTPVCTRAHTQTHQQTGTHTHTHTHTHSHRYTRTCTQRELSTWSSLNLGIVSLTLRNHCHAHYDYSTKESREAQKNTPRGSLRKPGLRSRGRHRAASPGRQTVCS